MTLSLSPLCPHVECGSADGWLRSLPVRPRAVKVFGPGPARDVKAVDPAITTVLRRVVPDQGPYLAQGVTGGRRFVDEQLDLDGVDIFEGLNECTGFDDRVALAQANAFHIGFTAACMERGVLPAILNIAVGNPSEALVDLLAPCVQMVSDAGGYVGCHGYGPAQLLASCEYYAMRGPLKLEPRLRAAGVSGPIRWIYTEAGFDCIGSYPGPSGPWRDLVARGVLTPDAVRMRYEGLATMLMSYGISMAFLFTFWGASTWAQYEHTTDPAMMEWYAEHLRTWRGPATSRLYIPMATN